MRWGIIAALVLWCGNICAETPESNVWITCPIEKDELTEEDKDAYILLVENRPGMVGKLTNKAIAIGTQPGIRGFRFSLLPSDSEARPIFNEKISVRYRADGGELTQQPWVYASKNRYDTILSKEQLVKIFTGDFVVFEVTGGDDTKRIRYDLSITEEVESFRKLLIFFCEKKGIVADFGEHTREADYWELSQEKRQLYRNEQSKRDQQQQLKEQRRKMEEKAARESAPPRRPFD